jgi:CelD/BcsL family acetyltransferase involved in cellulose biosynthesis
MELSLHHEFPTSPALAEEWNALLATSEPSTPFLRYEYLRAWWQGRGGGEWPQADLTLVLARQNGQLVGIAPLFRAVNPQGRPALFLLGSRAISDYLDVITAPAARAPFLAALLDFLNTPHLPAWEMLDWYNLLEDSPSIPVLQAEAQRRGWSWEIQNIDHAPHVPLPGDFETYLASLDKKQRHEIRRKMRRAAEGDHRVRWYIVRERERLEAEGEAFLNLMAHSAEKAAFLTPAMRAQMRLILQAAFDGGWLQLAFLEIDGEKAAAYLNFDYANRIWVYNSGLNPDFRELSPGWVLLAHLLQWANENGRAEFDFMRGDEEYKYRFGGIDRLVQRLTLTRP